ncbi:sulfur oxidation c-type cytochrome SoxX [Cereibacter sphaeroides]|uniref:sulfur oxidation c-type cytochrome SoxX n=1 Tax=Rhodobacterales TaxID=204455 RepID=UPI000BBE87FE|nr:MULTISPECIES: sulfur oxidation c-type cytochrome SoxX [Paracoccaceae]MCE6951477.1 sulfur oxidation c-type cytochrome SoxX [Cereibacter sphaeroides]MCE6960803.1 sulfur oxidation c-type cytochrome SoxX [Cereibacter sphaeroides]MCE6969931.1 sulfur oxidation c-type cytochrome SoxX [Cereibacter sphaeroides]MCE6974319.1 sulfur oxidation c-type cytochrome SoxX [Cereibacter sphaeroides]
MRHQYLLGIVTACLAVPALAEIGPGEVTFEHGALPVSLTGAPGDPAVGAKVMATRPQGNCVACHQIPPMVDVQFHGDVGPSLAGVASRYTEAQLRGIVANAKMTFEGSVMPAFYKNAGYIRPGDGYTSKPAPAELPPILTAQQIEDVVAYLLTLKE